MPREHVVELFLGATADAPSREAARARLMWISERALGPNALILGDQSGALSILLARAALFATGVVSVPADARALLEDLEEKIRARVSFVDRAPSSLFDSLIAVESIEPETFLSLKPGGRAIIALPFGEATLSTIALLARDHLSPLALEIRGGYVCFAGRRDEDSARDWEIWLRENPLSETAEQGALDLLLHYEARLAELEGSRRALVASSAKRGRLLERSIRDALEQNVRLREQVDRTRRSARYRLGSAFASAVKPSVETLKLPGKILEIYRAKSSGIAVEELERPDLEPRRRLFDERFDKFVHEARVAKSPWVIVIYSGTRNDGIRANRPWSLAQEFRARGIPVIFGYFGGPDGQLPNYSDPNLLELPEEILNAKLQKLAALEFHGKNKLFLNAYPAAAIGRALNNFNAHGWVTIYDALDDWEEFTRAGVAFWYSASVEKLTVASSDLTCAVSRPLAEKLSAYTDAPKVFLSPNALDPKFVATDYSRRPSTPPKIGYFGHLTPAWFDWHSLSTIAKKRPDYRFELIGYGAPSELDLPPNIRLLGPKDRPEINRIAAEWSAAIIPFKIGPLADAVDPIKIYEYLALGLPAVSFRMPQVADYPSTFVVNTAEEFLSALDEALAQGIDRAAVEKFLENNTWEKRTDALLAAAQSVVARGLVEKTLARGAAG
jgi:glycosyltransferase involved in cell wall biosynthesis